MVGPGNSARARAKEEEEEEKEPELPAEVSGDLLGEVVSRALDSVDPTTRFFQKNLAAKFVRVFN